MRFRLFLAPIALLILAAGLRVWQIDRVPPGLHDDEVINGEIVENDIYTGHPAVFYSTGGREGMFHLVLAGAMHFIGYNPLGFRWAGFAFGMLSLAAIYALARRLIGQQAALIALGFAAINFWALYEGRAATRSVSLIALSALAGLAFVRAWQQAERGQPRVRAWVLAGMLLGLSFYTYIAARVIPLIFALSIIYLAFAKRPVMCSTRRGVLVYAVTAAVVVVPLVIHLSLNPTVDLRFQMLTGGIDAARAGNWQPVLTTTLQTLGMFVWRGDPQWHYNVAGTPVFDPLTSALFLLGVIVAIGRARQWPYALYLIWIVVSLVPGMLSDPAPHYMRTAAAQVAAYAFVGLGGSTFVRGAERRASRFVSLAWVGLIAVWLIEAGVSYHNFFVVWPVNDEVRFYHQANVTEMARALDASPDVTPVVGCSPFLNEKEDWLRSPRQTIHFELRRTDLPIRWHDCRDSLMVPNGSQWREFVLYLMPPERNLPASITTWFTGTTPIALNTFGDSLIYPVDVRVRWATVLDEMRGAEVAFAPEAGGLTTTLPADFGHAIELIGYRVDKSAVRPGRQLQVTTYWRVTAPLPTFLTTFVHLLNAAGQIAAQIDRESVLADTLQPGDEFMQLHTIDLPSRMPPGSYRLSLGLYSSVTGQRLPIEEGDQPRGDRLMLQAITVKSP